MGAQSVRGGIRDESGAPIAGAVVMLLDARDSTIARALSGNRGDFALQAIIAGSYRLRTLRIGFRPWTSSPFPLAVGELVHEQFVVAATRFRLDTLRVSSRAQCGVASTGSPAPTSIASESVWEQVQAALAAAQVSVSQKPFVATTLYYERELDRTGQRILAQQSSIDHGNVAQPWQTVSPDQLHKRGYVAVDADSTAYHAPGLEALLSPWFLADHCLRVAASTDSTLVGVDFEPVTSRRRLAEVRGTLWLDRATSSLTRLTFQFVNVTRLQQDHAGGSMDFVRLRDGGWAISRWALRMPNLTLPERGSRADNIDPQITVRSIRQVGGELLVATTPRGTAFDTLWLHHPLVLSGMIIDAVSEQPVAEARLSLVGTSLEASTDTAGAFLLANVMPGAYAIEIRTAAMERAKRVFRSAAIMSDSASAVVFRIPTVKSIAKDSARVDSVRSTGARALVGSVLGISREPIAGAELSLPELSLRATSRPDGSFRFAAVPPGRHHFTVRVLGYGPLDATVETTDRATTTRTIFLTRLVMLDSVRVDADVRLPSFEENRRVGLGRFLTRDDLAKLEDRTLAAVFNDMGGVSLMRGENNRVWIGSSRRQLGSTVLDKSDKLQGAKPGCYAHVYLDNMRVYAGKHSEPLFDINSLSPDRIEAIEYYASPASTPARYSGLGATCGVVVIWSRRSP